MKESIVGNTENCGGCSHSRPQVEVRQLLHDSDRGLLRDMQACCHLQGREQDRRCDITHSVFRISQVICSAWSRQLMAWIRLERSMRTVRIWTIRWNGLMTRKTWSGHWTKADSIRCIFSWEQHEFADIGMKRQARRLASQRLGLL